MRVRERGADLGAPVLERHDERVARIRPEFAGPVHPDGDDARRLGRGERREVALVALREHDDLARTHGWGEPGIVGVRDGRRVGHERREPVLEDGRLVAEGDLRPARAERAAKALGRAAGDRATPARGGRMRAHVPGGAHRDPAGRELVAAHVERRRLGAGRIGRRAAADLAVDVNPAPVRQLERRARKRKRSGGLGHRCPSVRRCGRATCTGPPGAPGGRGPPNGVRERGQSSRFGASQRAISASGRPLRRA